MASVRRFIQWRLRLRINDAKSAVARPEDRHFLGFSLRVAHGRRRTVEVLLSQRTKRNAMARIRGLTPRTWGGTLESCIARINAWLRGWHQFFGIASTDEQQAMRTIDAHIRRRLRAILLHHWKRQRTIARRLIALGVKPHAAWRAVYAGKKSTWALSHAPAVDHGLRNAYFANRGLISVAKLHRGKRPAISAPAHPTMAVEQG
jgi:RNA-directed DNA polymerase